MGGGTQTWRKNPSSDYTGHFGARREYLCLSPPVGTLRSKKANETCPKSHSSSVAKWTEREGAWWRHGANSITVTDSDTWGPGHLYRCCCIHTPCVDRARGVTLFPFYPICFSCGPCLDCNGVYSASAGYYLGRGNGILRGCRRCEAMDPLWPWHFPWKHAGCN